MMKMLLPSTDEEREGMRAFLSAYDERRDVVAERILEVAATIEAFRPILELLSVEEQQAQDARARALQTAAIREDDWAPYLADLGEQGRVYAQLGVRYADWFGLLTAFRAPVTDHLVSRLGPSPEALRAALLGMGRFLDIAMSTIGQAYLDERDRLTAAAEDAHRRAEAREAGLILAAPDAIITIDEQSRIVAFNPAAEAIFGYSVEEAVGGSLPELIIPVEHRDAHRAGLARVAASRAEHRGKRLQLRAMRKSGELFPADLTIVRLGTEPPLFTGVLRDVSEREHAEQSLLQRTDELERSNVELDNFAYVASHDLRAPLRDVDNLAGWIVEDLGEALPAESERHLRTLQSRVRRMELLLQDLLEYSRAGRVFGTVEPIDVASLLREVEQLASPPPGMVITLPPIAKPRIAVTTPRAPLRQILLNLITNAIKHHDGPDGSIVVSLRDADDFIELTVEDDGPGIPPNLHERAFGMFQTLRPRDQVEGTGMGLALVRKLVRVHGGSLSLRSAEGEGAAFTFTWPKDWKRPIRASVQGE